MHSGQSLAQKSSRGVEAGMWGRLSETVSEFFVNPKSCHDINAETEPTRCRMLLQLAVGSKQPL